jgi:predicted RNA-binding Zn ribbon-like protein
MTVTTSGHTTHVGGEAGREPPPGQLRLVQDFVNTLDSDNGLRQIEHLTDPAALERWLRSRGLIGRGTRIGTAELARALRVRAGLRALLLANNGLPLDPAAVPALNDASERAHSAVRFADDGDAELVPAGRGLDGAIARLLAIVASSMADGSWERFKACRNPDCEWAFYDGSRNRSSRWCTMAECGNRAKARAFRERHRHG